MPAMLTWKASVSVWSPCSAGLTVGQGQGNERQPAQEDMCHSRGQFSYEVDTLNTVAGECRNVLVSSGIQSVAVALEDTTLVKLEVTVSSWCLSSECTCPKLGVQTRGPPERRAYVDTGQGARCRRRKISSSSSMGCVRDVALTVKASGFKFESLVSLSLFLFVANNCSFGRLWANP